MSSQIGRFTVCAGEKSFDVDVEPGGQIRVEGWTEPVVVAPVELNRTGTYRVMLGGRSVQVFVADAGETRWVFADGDVFEFDVQRQGAVRRRPRAPHDMLSAPMPATVVKILAEPGRAVRRGDTLIVLEAMKMELSVRAPREGTVRGVYCDEGELVAPGKVLVEID